MSRSNTPYYTYQVHNPQSQHQTYYVAQQCYDGRYDAPSMRHDPSQSSDSSHGSHGYSSNNTAGMQYTYSDSYTYAPISAPTRYQPNPSEYYTHTSSQATATPRSYHPTSTHQPHLSPPPQSPPSHSHKPSVPKPKSFHCLYPDCSSAFARSYDLNRHYKTHQQAPQRFDCRYGWCGRGAGNGFTREDHLRDHIKRVHKGAL